MSQILAIALNTFREAIRNRIFFTLAMFAVGMLLLTMAVSAASLNEEVRLMKDVGLFLTSTFCVVIAIFVGVNLVYKEIERKTIYTIMPKPIYRWQFLLGKYLGLAATLAVLVLAMGAVLAALFEWVAQEPGGFVLLIGLGLGWWLADWAVQAVGARRVDAAARGDLPIVFDRIRRALMLLAAGGLVTYGATHLAWEVQGALLLIYIEVLIVIAVALVFSSFSTPFLSGALAFGVFLVGRFADRLRTLKLVQRPEDVGGPLEDVQAFVRGVAEVVPDLSRFNATPYVVYDAHIPGEYLWHASVYGLTYAGLCLLLAMALFMRRDFV